MLLSLHPKLKPKLTHLFSFFLSHMQKRNNTDMELGLTLGDNPHYNQPSKTPFGFLDKTPQIANKGSSFCMALSIATPNHELSEYEERQAVDEYPKAREPKTRKRPESVALTDGDHTSSCVDPTALSLQLDLLPNTPVPRNHRYSFPWSSDNGGSNEVGCWGKAVGLVNVKRKPTIEEADQDGICGGDALSSSPPNSSASSFQMDFCMYSKGGSYEADQRASSRASDDDENGGTRKKLRLSKEQSAFLEESFKEHSTLNPKQKQALAKQLNLRPRQVEVWFQNRRARTKLKQTEVDCEYLKRCCETLTEENRRLHKELQELRALKTSSPFYMQSPATTLTMCPSCERVAITATPTTTTSTNSKDNTTDPSVPPSKDPSDTKPKFYPFSIAASQPQQPSTTTS